MCCKYSIIVGHSDSSRFEELIREIWGKPDSETNTVQWEDPARVWLGSQVNIKLMGVEHNVTPESWVICTKYSISLYLRARDEGIPTTLRKMSNPCPPRDIGTLDGILDLEKLCIEGVQSLRNYE